METVIYTMTEDIKNDFCERDIRNIDDTLDMVQKFSQEEYADLCIDNIIPDLIKKREECVKKINNNLDRIHNLMIFYYRDRLIDYKIQYNQGMVTGEIIVCLE